MPDTDLRVAVIGLGRMGGLIARRVLAAGMPLTVQNRSVDKAAPLLEQGALWAPTPREAAAAADVVITSLMDDASIHDAAHGADGIMRGLKQGGIHLCATTISPAMAAALAAAHELAGSVYVAGPVVGRPGAAASGHLASFVGGPAAAIDLCRPVLATYAARIVPMGPDPAVANEAKLLTNYVAYAGLDLIGQVHSYGERAGIPPGFIREMLNGCFAHPALRGYNDRIAGRLYDEVEFDTIAGLKDLDLIHAATSAARAPLAFAGIVRDRFLAAIANGLGNRDMCTTAEITRGLAGLKSGGTA
jgi:3-hydroxyisobutyrate dehydrogenase-like beta-hydroxyacid dehydrogenase